MSFWNSLTWTGRVDNNKPNDYAALRSITIAADAEDTDNDPVTTLRKGLAMGIKTSTGLAYPYDPDATDGTQHCVGILNGNTNLIQGDNPPANTNALVFTGGLMNNAFVIGDDLRALTEIGTHLHYNTEFRVSTGPNMYPRYVERKAADYTVLSADHGVLFVATAAVNFTLPTKANGLCYRFFQTADANLVITGSSDIIIKGNATASTLTCSTSSEKIGSHILVECVYTATSTLRWIASNLGSTTITVA